MVGQDRSQDPNQSRVPASIAQKISATVRSTSSPEAT